MTADRRLLMVSPYRRPPPALAVAQVLFFADSAYDRGVLMGKAAIRDFIIEIVRHTDKETGFKVIPRRWVVERTFGWMIRWRRLVRDLDVSEAMIHGAMGALLVRRIAHPQPFSN